MEKSLPFYKFSSDGKVQNKSVRFDLDELRTFIKRNIDVENTGGGEPFPDKCVKQGGSVVSIITPTLTLYSSKSASQSGKMTTISTKEQIITASPDDRIADSGKNKMMTATNNIAVHQPTVSPSNLHTITSSDNVSPTAENIHPGVEGTKPLAASIDPTSEMTVPTTSSNTPTTEYITPATSNATPTSQILVAPTTPATVNIVDDFLSATAASTSIGRLKNDLTGLQKSYPQADFATLLTTVDETLTFYKFVSLVTTLSFFIDTIKDAHPEAAGYYKNQLKNLLNNINQHYAKKTDSDRTKRAPWEFAEVLKNLVAFESAPMKAEMLSFFKGFEEMRVELIDSVHSGFSISPELRTLIDTLQSSDVNIGNLMRQINKETADLVSESN
ncbi:hypothetical protein [Endozoicomonas sp. SCSIO W0465]|uniref:hypothetical protein n=1 Tax=Endozoicomonas sp. SCSIO W0465 TaxID=2918516 RepID=UPI00207583FF|nr:hypothetical protein [Endozoicomonas sp. SCSIO W0465]USE38773.1 hypothetical protein MJO57_11725 [Endozoicomonas sp. SCSIO W0465]